jgi:hypothetical protein
MAMYLMLFSTGQFLKLISFHHTVYDNRILLIRLTTLPDQTKVKDLEWLSPYLNVNAESLKIALEYPKNLRIGHYIRYLCAPTCCY